jgi:hypothetical protein
MHCEADGRLHVAGNTNSGWAFGGGGAPMGNANFQNQTRQMGGNLSFAQSLSGSQPAAPLDMSYVLSHFPSRPTNLYLADAHLGHIKLYNFPRDNCYFMKRQSVRSTWQATGGHQTALTDWPIQRL